ncbi:hypothetical protein [Capnocytophaga catalasegens]|uniref:Lipoprotein n=1 Tax=Capnocytophaga catalasegens TaxID=1004260 RepID=A0AAV5AUR2_9FLAO|nr:hypothetical protein [Capnocytophaga catalasegens]GIZ16343.1 hypothetical protein RCZ03_23430 [Capnocytophaga catalasegens]GJM49131.1 hypothetical protein RCZ15_01070 [Capnocytophaga catalasegens]GJM53685.1 hypothetical protein RCZ16_20010 [Capnocytophaga catalasegens]
MNKTGKILMVITLIISCMKPTDNNIIWTAKYNFANLYGQKVYNSYFNTGAAIEIEEFLYTKKGENFKFYRYKNFVYDFDYSKAIYFSYDYGKT